MVVVAGATAAGLYFGDRAVLATARRYLQADFNNRIASLQQLEQQRRSTLAEHCRVLVDKPRLHAALEDNALDLLYPTAKDELRELLSPDASPTDNSHARFYRFLDKHGTVIEPQEDSDAGAMSGEEKAQLVVHELPYTEQIGYVDFTQADDVGVDEVIAVPITSTETGETISALVAGFPIGGLSASNQQHEIRSGIMLHNHLWFPGLKGNERTALAARLSAAAAASDHTHNNFAAKVDGKRFLVFYEQLNPGSVFAPAYEVCLYPLTEFAATQTRVRMGMLGGGLLLLVAGLLTTQFATARLTRPVEALAIQREHATKALATTSAELQRSERFSADASHQLKSPVAVLRAGIESLMARADLAPEVYDELSSMLHQTYRLTGVVNDLLLLSRMDAGRLQIEFQPVNLTKLIEEWIDDLSALPDALDTHMETDVAGELWVEGEKRYIDLVVQNLLENARKYNREGGRIHVEARQYDGRIHLTVGNTGLGIAPDAQQTIFERFHRASIGERVPGHGLGLNLARELTRLHGGELKLVTSIEDWTEFEVSFRAADGKASQA